MVAELGAFELLLFLMAQVTFALAGEADLLVASAFALADAVALGVGDVVPVSAFRHAFKVVSSAHHHVVGIVGRRSRFQMVWVDAGRVIALVTNEVPVRDGAYVEFIHDAVHSRTD